MCLHKVSSPCQNFSVSVLYKTKSRENFQNLSSVLDTEVAAVSGLKLRSSKLATTMKEMLSLYLRTLRLKTPAGHVQVGVWVIVTL